MSDNRVIKVRSIPLPPTHPVMRRQAAAGVNTGRTGAEIIKEVR